MTRLTGENKIIQLLKDRYQTSSPWLEKGIGDDAAVISPRNAFEHLVITTDMLLEGIDFRPEWTTPRQLGIKSLAVNLSDLAAMGVRPCFYTVSLAIPPGSSERWIREFYDGVTGLGNAHNAKLIGGDLSSSDGGIMISITAVGESLNRKVLYRSGGRPGDTLYVTGTLGRSAAGLALLKAGYRKSRSGPRQEALSAHRTPEPRCDEGVWLAQSGLVHGMMDLSDGLSIDLPRMCAACGAGAEISREDIPCFKKAVLWNGDPEEFALHGGEDYELLFSAPKAKIKALENSYPSRFPPITRIGEMTAESGKILLRGPGKEKRPLPQRGYDHFSGAGKESRKKRGKPFCNVSDG
ncbi:MAG TPA: thiamine-phosphate kinase [Acidobacteriota bacterium]|nr:thiamine-phosphate kinase [Acidobacteriota bacterium]